MQTYYVLLNFVFLFLVEGQQAFDFTTVGTRLVFKKNPTEDDHRCGVCPTYLQKVCAFDFGSNATFIFDNHCIMDMYNCLEVVEFVQLNYDHCLYFGNFAYVHGYKLEDEDYGEDHLLVKGSKKNPPFV